MTTESLNQQLQQIYKKYTDVLYQKNWDGAVSAPLLMHIFDDYVNMDKKIMFVGQETHGWGWMMDKPSVENLQEKYRAFSLGKCADYGDGKPTRYLKSPFWNFNRSLFHALNKQNLTVFRRTNGFLWTNVSKFDCAQTTPSQELQDLNLEGFELLRQEIAICQPDIVVFLTGAKYHNKINSVFNIERQEVVTGLPLWRISTVNAGLPNLTFETEHPRTLCQNEKYRKDRMYHKVLDAILREAT